MGSKIPVITRLRWVKRLSDPNNFNSEEIRVLQQEVTFFKESLTEPYSTEWEDVEIEEENR